MYRFQFPSFHMTSKTQVFEKEFEPRVTRSLSAGQSRDEAKRRVSREAWIQFYRVQDPVCDDISNKEW